MLPEWLLQISVCGFSRSGKLCLPIKIVATILMQNSINRMFKFISYACYTFTGDARYTVTIGINQ